MAHREVEFLLFLFKKKQRLCLGVRFRVCLIWHCICTFDCIEASYKVLAAIQSRCLYWPEDYRAPISCWVSLGVGVLPLWCFLSPPSLRVYLLAGREEHFLLLRQRGIVRMSLKGPGEADSCSVRHFSTCCFFTFFCQESTVSLQAPNGAVVTVLTGRATSHLYLRWMHLAVLK
jgi:hypothetical protein